MASAQSLAALFEAISDNIELDRADLNRLDHGDGDTGDNMAQNFALVAKTLQRAVHKAGPDADIGVLLEQAAKKLRTDGHGSTAPIYAAGFSEAARRLAGKTGFSLDDLLPLLEGLLRGSQQASGREPGDGSLIDVLLPGILSYVQSKEAGDGELAAILKALMNLRRGANSTSAASKGSGSRSTSHTRGRIDPGAAGAASLLEGLFGALLQAAIQHNTPDTKPAKTSTTRRTKRTSAKPKNDIGDLLGELFGHAGQLHVGGKSRSS